MTAPLLARLRARGVRLEPVEDGIRYRAPRGALSDSDRAALVEHRDELVVLLEAEAARPPMPPTACLGCATTAWTWTADWPARGEGRWLCATCSAPDGLTSRERLRAAYDGLTPEDRARFAADVADGDPLARVLSCLMAEGTA